MSARVHPCGADSCVRRGMKSPAILLRTSRTSVGGTLAFGSLSSARSCTPIALAFAMRAGAMPLPRVVSLAGDLGAYRPVGHGSAVTMDQFAVSRGVASDKGVAS